MDSSSPEERLATMITNIVAYQRSLGSDRLVALQELCAKGVLSAADIEYMRAQSVTYKPQMISSPYLGDMLQIPLEEGGYLSVGPRAVTPPQQIVSLSQFNFELEALFKPRPAEMPRLLCITLSDQDEIGIARNMISFTLQSEYWLQRRSTVLDAAERSGFTILQDNESQGRWLLTLSSVGSAAMVSDDILAFVKQACSFDDHSILVISLTWNELG